MTVQMKYPGYLLNPGDMFSVDPELVMLSTGMQNTEGRRKYVYNNPPPDAPASFESIKNQSKRKEERRQKSEEADTVTAPEKATSQVQTSAEAPAEASSSAGTPAETSPKAPAQEAPTTTEASAETMSEAVDPLSANKLKSELQKIEAQLNTYLSAPLGKGYTFRTRAAKRIHALRQLRREVREAIKSASETSASAEETLKPLENKFKSKSTKPDLVKSHLQTHLATLQPTSKAPPQPHIELLQKWPNAPRQDKGYLTPWLPRNWMSAFAFIPRYLEVNQNVCSAVYLRHPVARPGVAEVPSPFSSEMGLLAYQWYLRRR
jgi:ribosomal protein S4